jgi:putative Ca2+/H+ antiporter (TMEM165/GDT1 family)
MFGKTDDTHSDPTGSPECASSRSVRAARIQHPMQSFLVSTSVVGLAEIGDKTQLLSLVLAARYRKPSPIVLGVLAATLINHAASGAPGAWLASILSPDILNWAVVASFAVLAVWILIPDKLEDADAAATKYDGCLRHNGRDVLSCRDGR